MTATMQRQARRAGWLTERVLRSGMPEQWAFRRGEDRLYVTMHADGGRYRVRATALLADGDRLTRTTWHDDIEEARNAFTNQTRRLTMGEYPES